MSELPHQKGIISFQGLEKESFCQVDIYFSTSTVVIITELEANQGSSAVNSIKSVALAIQEKYELNPDSIFFIHYSPKEQWLTEREIFHAPPLEWNGTDFNLTHANSWPQVTQNEIKQLIGKIHKS